MEPMSTDPPNDDMNTEVQVKQLPHLDRRLQLMYSSLNGMKNVYELRKVVVEGALKKFESDGDLLVVISKPWQNFVNGKWIICVPVRNAYDHAICDVQYLINDGSFNEIETRVYKFNCSTAHRLCSKNDMLPTSTAYLVGIVNVKNFPNLFDECRLSCSILFRISFNDNEFSEKELLIPPFQLQVLDLINGNLGLFNSDSNLSQDVVMSTMTSDVVVLELHFRNQKRVNLREFLIKTFKFVEVKESLENCIYYVMKLSKHLLDGLVVYVSDISEYVISFICYPRDGNQVDIFKHSLTVSLKNDLVKVCEKEEKFSLESTSILSAVNALNEEFNHFTTKMKVAFPCPDVPVEKETSLKLTGETWKELMGCSQPFNTDFAIQKLNSS